MPHVHIGAVEFFTTGLYLIVFSFLWRSVSAMLGERPLGRAMAAIL